MPWGLNEGQTTIQGLSRVQVKESKQFIISYINQIDFNSEIKVMKIQSMTWDMTTVGILRMAVKTNKTGD